MLIKNGYIIPNYSQHDATFLDFLHQERTTVHAASGIVSQYCC
jgi:hypothetical protein